MLSESSPRTARVTQCLCFCAEFRWLFAVLAVLASWVAMLATTDSEPSFYYCLFWPAPALVTMFVIAILDELPARPAPGT